MTKYNKIAFIFPGQGAQYVGMGDDFKDVFPIARDTFEEGDEILQRSLSNIVSGGPEDLLTKTGNSQPAIFLNSVAVLRVICNQIPSLAPAVCAGLSLGEYTAVMASGMLDFATTLQLVQHRATFMNEACEMTKGTMAVVMGLDHDAVEGVVAELNMPNDVWAANFNCPGQVVISGTLHGVEKAAAALKARGARRVLPLPVHGAFHSGLMSAAEGKLSPYIHAADIADSDVNLVMNVPGGYTSGASNVKENLIAQITHPVRWERGVRAMMEEGVDLFIEIGCGKTLTGMNKRIGVTAPTVSVDKVADLEALHGVITA
jgi:[acyl-carrier-protein] S-malonyltransferase